MMPPSEPGPRSALAAPAPWRPSTSKEVTGDRLQGTGECLLSSVTSCPLLPTLAQARTLLLSARDRAHPIGAEPLGEEACWMDLRPSPYQQALIDKAYALAVE